MSNDEHRLVRYAREELDRAGMFYLDSEDDPEVGTDGELGQNILAIVKLVSEQQHSRTSLEVVTRCLDSLLRSKPLTPLTDDPAEWRKFLDGLWQSRRDSDAYSLDGGYSYTIGDDERVHYSMGRGSTSARPEPYPPPPTR